LSLDVHDECQVAEKIAEGFSPSVVGRLAVPSVIVPEEFRYDPIYPHHPAYESTVEVGELFDLGWNPRLAEERSPD
jgi:hypothetical protein